MRRTMPNSEPKMYRNPATRAFLLSGVMLPPRAHECIKKMNGRPKQTIRELQLLTFGFADDPGITVWAGRIGIRTRRPYVRLIIRSNRVRRIVYSVLG